MKVLSGSGLYLTHARAEEIPQPRSAFPHRAPVISSRLLSDRGVTRSLPVSSTWPSTAKLAVDPTDLQAPRSRKPILPLETLASCHLPRFCKFASPHPTNYLTPRYRHPHPCTALSDRRPSAQTEPGRRHRHHNMN